MIPGVVRLWPRGRGYGDAESARDYYAHVQKPKKGVIQASSVYALRRRGSPR